MSINTISSNPMVLTELATGLAPYFPDTGITSLPNTANISCVVAGTVGTISLNPNISVAGLAATGTVNLTNFTNPWVLNQPASNGYILSSTTGGALSWVPDSSPSTTGLLKEIGIVITQNGVSAVLPNIVIFDYNNVPISGFTVGKLSIIEFDITFNATAAVAAYFNMSLTVDGNVAQPSYILSAFDTSGAQNRSVKFIYTNTSTSQIVSLSLGQSTSIVSPAVVSFSTTTTDYICMNITEQQ